MHAASLGAARKIVQQFLWVLSRASGAAAAIESGPVATQALLDQNSLLADSFNFGVLAYGLDGTAIAEAPQPGVRVGVNYMDNATVVAALHQGQSTFSEIHSGKTLRAPVFGMTVPVRDAQGKVVGALSGVISLGRPNFLDRVTANTYGQTGGYLLIAPKQRLIVTATDKSRIMEQLPPPGAVAALDRIVDGHAGSAVFVNPLGVEVLVSGTRIAATGWIIEAVLPTAEAFSPIRSLQQRLLLATLMLSLLAAVLTWLMLRSQLAPMLATVKTLARLTENSPAPQALTAAYQDEFGDLIQGFNRLLQTLAQREAALHDSAQRYRQLVADLQVGVLIQSPSSQILMSNQLALELLGLSEAQLLGKTAFDPSWNIVHDDGSPFPGETQPVPQAVATGKSVENVVMGVFRHTTQSRVWLLVTAKPQFYADGRLEQVICTFSDITALKQAAHYENQRNHILEMLAKDEPLARILETLVMGVEQLHQGALCSILLLSNDGRRLERTVAPSLPDFYNAAIDGVEIGPGVGSCGTAAFTGARVMVQDISTHPYWAAYKDLAARAGLGACWSQPFFDAGGQVLGTFAIYHAAPHAPKPADIVLIEQSAQLASIAIEKNLAQQRLRDSEAQFRLLTEQVSDVIWRQDSNHVFTYISPADERLRGFRADEVIGQHASALLTQEGLATMKTTRQTLQDAQPGVPAGAIIVEVQQRCKDGRLIWTEVLSTPERDAQGTITGYHGISREITERKQMQDQMRQMAFFDPLTTLPNRRMLDDRLRQTMAASSHTGRYGALIFLDLDNFKPLNDSHGHDVGDLLLMEVAQRLKANVREMDTVVRIGGDEFVVMLSELKIDRAESRLQAGLIAEKVRLALAEPYRFTVQHDGRPDRTVTHHCTASLGVALFVNQYRRQADVMKWADTALYQAKDAGRNCVRFYGETTLGTV